jgi:hypothetical protein
VRAAFTGYLAALNKQDPDTPRDEQLAFWINAYNSTRSTDRGETQTESIRNINKSFGLKLKDGSDRSQSGRPIIHPRRYRALHHPTDVRKSRAFTLRWSARHGVSPLRSEAYTGARLAAQLEGGVRAS